MTTRHRVTSKDGTSITYERSGAGTPVVLVSGALQGLATYRPLAEELASRCTVFNYDRRGRGGSDSPGPYTVERELEDLAAVIAEAGASAAVYGHSSGAGLVLHAAASGLAVDRIILHEPPFGPDSEQQQRSEQEEADKIAGFLADGRPAAAIRHFLTPMGMPPEVTEQISEDPGMQANARTLRYDPFDVMSEQSRGGATPTEQAGTITVPALVIAGSDSPEWMIDAGRRIANAVPNGRIEILDGQEHIVPPQILAPVVTEFLASA